MTENEAIEVLKDFDKQASAKADGAYQTAIGEMACKVAISALEEIQQYRALGTVEELREAMEKQRAKKPHKNFEKFSGVWCSCGNYLGKINFANKQSYCSDCGQAIDWSEEE